MKVLWEADDIEPGRTVGVEGRSERWMIGYLAGENSDKRYVLVSLSDGMVQSAITADGLATQLNITGEQPAEMLTKARKAKGGYARAAKLSPTRRSEIAKQAADVRWNGKQ